MANKHNKIKQIKGFAFSAGLVCLIVAQPLAAQQSGIGPTSGLDSTAHELMHNGSEEDGMHGHFQPFPLITPESNQAILPFDLGGSDRRKLQIHLSDGFSFDQSSAYDQNLGYFDTESTLNWLLTSGLDISAGLEQAQLQFQPVGSIRCEDGILAAGSYRASNCYFVNPETDNADSNRLIIGSNWRSDRASGGVNLFRQQSTAGSLTRSLNNTSAPTIGRDLLTPVLSNPLLPQATVSPPMDYLESEVTGIDLNFQLGVATGNSGDLQLGLQLTRVLDGDYQGLNLERGTQYGWTLADSFNTAQLNVDWRKGSFSGGIQSFYREQVEFINRQSLEPLTTFDVHFTWRTPWNANLSIGASNILNAGKTESSNSNDPFESVYGRIPYVRYQQDL